MNVYDFDDTIYDGQSWLDFMKYCIKKKHIIIFYMTKDLSILLLMKLHIVDDKNIKISYCNFLYKIDDIEKLIEEFWKENNNKIKKWFVKRNSSDDILLTASPEFFLTPLKNIYNFNIIGTKVNPIDGSISGNVCYGLEKLKRFRELYPNAEYDFYTDDLKADRFVANTANNCYKIKKNKIKTIKKKSGN